MTEQEFLLQQQAAARRELVLAAEGLKQSLAEAADVRNWTRQHPWAAVGIAAAAGFAAASAFSRRSAAQSTNAQPAARSDSEPIAASSSAQPAPAAPRGSWLAGWLGPLFDLAKVALQGVVTNSLRQAMAPAMASPPDDFSAEEAAGSVAPSAERTDAAA